MEMEQNHLLLPIRTRTTPMTDYMFCLWTKMQSNQTLVTNSTFCCSIAMFIYGSDKSLCVAVDASGMCAVSTI